MTTDSNLPTGGRPQEPCPPKEAPAHQAAQAPGPVPAQAPGAEQERTRRKLYLAVVVAVVAVLALGLVAAKAFLGDADRGQRDPNAALGQLEGKSEEEIQAELDRIVEEGMFNVSISSVVEFADGASEGDLCIENVPGNRYLMQVVITRDDTGEQIYQTGLIDPNYHIKSDVLDVDLDAGEYACTATFFASDAETEEAVGQAAVKMTVKVLG